MKNPDILHLGEIITAAVRSRHQWAVWLYFHRETYEAVRASASGSHLPVWYEYLKQEAGAAGITDDYNLLTMLGAGGHALIFCPNEEEAHRVFKTIPEGSLVGAELYNPQGQFWSDNT